MNHLYFLAYKPFNVLSQFTSEGAKSTLAAHCTVPRDVYPVGRLDFDSEGLIILTNDASVNHRLLSPSFRHEREYWVQLDGSITPEALRSLREGVQIRVGGKVHHTLPAETVSFAEAPEVPERIPPIRYRAHIPTSWIRLVLTEGKNRQVRRMTAAVGFPTLRLIRYRIGAATIEGMKPGDCVSVGWKELEGKLFGR